MSRIGKLPIPVPAGVEVNLDGQVVSVKGPKGTLSLQVREPINVARNDAWVPKLEQRLKAANTDDHLVVVGAMHLLGSDGVVEKLRAKGYKVDRVCSACSAKPNKK